MEIFFLLVLIALMAIALGSGYPVAFALPGAAIISVLAAAICGYLYAGDVNEFFAVGGPGQWLSAGVTNLRGVYWEPERDTLIAIPLFIFMGIMLQRSRIAEDLLITMAQLFGPVPGGLGISVVFVGALLAATTGIVGATVVAMGLISLPAMLRNNYSKPLATGTIAASGTLGQIIPPSIVLIILADQLASAADQAGTARTNLYKAATGELTMPTTFAVTPTSAGEMFLGAFVPGLVLVALYMVFILLFALIRPGIAPAIRREGRLDRAFAAKVLMTLVPPITLILLVLGSIIAGVATVNQAGAIGAAGALIMAGYKLREDRKGAYYPSILALASLVALVIITNRFDVNVKAIDSAEDRLGLVLATIGVAALTTSLIWSGWRAFTTDDTLRGVMIETAKTTSLVFIILLGAAMLTAAFRSFGGEELVRDFLTGLPGGFWVQFVIVMAVIFVLGFFLDFIEIAVVVVPIVAPILLADPAANITAVWLGVMIGLNIQTSFLTPPFGFALFYLRGVADASVRTVEIYKGVVAFILLQLFALLIVGLTPPLVNYLPNRISLLSDTAPPPRNPALQYCVERYVFNTLGGEQGDLIRRLVDQANTLDMGYLPEDRREQLTGSLQGIGSLFDQIREIGAAEQVVGEAIPQYRPVHVEVRRLQREMENLADRIAEEKTQLSRVRGDSEASEARRARLQDEIAELEAEREALQSAIPDDWDRTREEFVKLQRAESSLRNNYRRTADEAYGELADLVAAISDTKPMEEAGALIEPLPDSIRSGPPEAAIEQIEQAEAALGELAGAGDIRSSLSRARRELAKDNANMEEVGTMIAEALAEYRGELDWRSAAETEMLPLLAQLEEGTRSNIGLRQLDRLPGEQALEVASCKAVHRDISLNF